jgi:hypothetical protein
VHKCRRLISALIHALLLPLLQALQFTVLD